mmetsp:Transcript_92057/g.269360  ORF Transcript_92057/g.269360 Transcript_92057/m.269360 type:complete len:203 (-) Transcript_92057:217-825(-)
MFSREKLRQLGASVIADLGHAPPMSKPRRAAGRRSSGADVTVQAVGNQGKATPVASTKSTIDTPDNVSTCTASVADSFEVQDSTMDSDKDTWGMWAPPPPQPVQPGFVGPAAWAPASARPAGERRAPWECAGPAAGPWPAQDYMGTPMPMGTQHWGADNPVWVAAQEAMPSFPAKGPHEPMAAAPMYVRIPGMEKTSGSRPR